MKITAIVPAAGSSSRYSSNKNKLFENLCGEPVIIKTLKALQSVDEIDEIIVCTSKNIIDEMKELISFHELKKVNKVILGGKSRQESVYKGLKECDGTDMVLIHDGARPLISSAIIQQNIKDTKTHGAAIVAVQTKDTIKVVDDSLSVESTLDRSKLRNVQTPQSFKYNRLLAAHERFKQEIYTDDSALIEKIGDKVFITKGEYKNIKITTQEDLLIAEIFSK